MTLSYPLHYTYFANRGIETHTYENRFEFSHLIIQEDTTNLNITVSVTLNKQKGLTLIFNSSSELLEIYLDHRHKKERQNQLSLSILALLHLLNTHTFSPPYQENNQVFTVFFKEIQSAYRRLKSVNNQVLQFKAVYQVNFSDILSQISNPYRLIPRLHMDHDNILLSLELQANTTYQIQNIDEQILKPLRTNGLTNLDDTLSLYLSYHLLDSFSQSLIDWLSLQMSVGQDHKLPHLVRITPDFLDKLIPLLSQDRWNIPIIPWNKPIKIKNHTTPEGLHHIKITPRLVRPPLLSKHYWLYLSKDGLYFGKAKLHDAFIGQLFFPIQEEVYLTEPQMHLLHTWATNQTASIVIEEYLLPPEQAPLTLYLDGLPTKGYILSIKNSTQLGNFYPDWLDGLSLHYIITPNPDEQLSWTLQAREAGLDDFLSLQTYLTQFGPLRLSKLLQAWQSPEDLTLTIETDTHQDALCVSIKHQEFELPPQDRKDFLLALKQIDPKKERLSYNASQDFILLHQLLHEINLDVTENSIQTIPFFRLSQLQSFQFQHLDFQVSSNPTSLFSWDQVDLSSRPYQLKPHQKDGIEWLMHLRQMGLSGILADDMGLGKTLQMIAYLDINFPNMTQPSLILLPASLLHNWMDELRRFAPHLPLKIVSGHQKERLDCLSHGLHTEPYIYLTTYDYFKRDIEAYQNISFDTLILDEAQIIKNPDTQIKEALSHLVSRHRFALTGTPIENHLKDLWSIFDFILPGYLHDFAYFKHHFLNPIHKGESSRQKRLKNIIKPFILRRLKSQILDDLPDKKEITYYLPLHPDNQNLYDLTLREARSMLQPIDSTINNNNVTFLNTLIRLRQIALDGRIVAPLQDTIPTKFETCLEIISDAQKHKESVLIFSSFKEGLVLLSKYLESLGLSYGLFTGSTPKSKRDLLVQQFQTGKIPILLISLKAGGLGLNLTQASHVIHLDPWWNWAAQNQATDRAHRINQEKQLTVHHLISLGTIEEEILNLQAEKQTLLDILIPENSSTLNQYKDIFLSLLHLN